MQKNRSLFSESFLASRPLLERLGQELSEAARNFRNDPKAFIVAILEDDATGSRRRRNVLKLGFAVGLVLYAAVFFVVLITWMFAHKYQKRVDAKPQIILINPIFPTKPIELAKGDGEDNHGGGGGGKGSSTAASAGDLPQFSLMQPIIAPNPRPVLTPPAVPIAETVMVDPRLQRDRDPNAITGLPDGVVGPPSNGPGSNGGIGTGDKGGIGPGHGRGVGPGEDYNAGDGRARIASGPRDTTPTSVDQLPRALYKPRPAYTEEARKNRVQGVIRVRVLLGADGSIKGIELVNHLPDGLDEEAITAIKQMRFLPAVKGGQPVPYHVIVEVEFNLR